MIEDKYNIKFYDYLEVIKGLFIWFLGAKETGINSPQFNMNNIASFYIDKNKFDKKFIQTIEALSKDIGGFYGEFNKSRKDSIDNDVYLHFQSLFDYPIFKINNSQFCVIDFKFLVEGICAGLIWKIDAIIKDSNKNYSIQNIREQYGYLLEEYFAFLMNKIFCGIKLTYKQNGHPDAVLEANVNGKSYIVIFEFTTKFYRLSSLYNRASNNFVEDLNRVLFTPLESPVFQHGVKYPEFTRGIKPRVNFLTEFTKTRNDTGKFINLNKYASNYAQTNKIVIPILITENWFGDYDLINRVDNILNKKISEHHLDSLVKYKPIILSLDDLETFWAISTGGKETVEFIDSLDIWAREQKWKYWFSYANFVSTERRLVNKEYLQFFSTANLGKKGS